MTDIKIIKLKLKGQVLMEGLGWWKKGRFLLLLLI